MKWYEISISIAKEAEDAMLDVLLAIGAGGAQIEGNKNLYCPDSYSEDVIYEPEDLCHDLSCDNVILKAYFSENEDIEKIISQIQEEIKNISMYLPVNETDISYVEINDEDWSTSWKKYYKPFKVSKNIVIKPSWEPYERCMGEQIIEIDPGMAFGTGTHETTKMCINLIEKYIKEDDRVIDIGSGSGILSIAALKLGAKEVVALDIDSVAVNTTLQNCEINDVKDKIHVYKGELKDIKIIKEKFDIVVANIIANSIIEISNMLKNYLTSTGLVITSGIIKDRKQEVIDEYINIGFLVEEIIEDGEWVAILFRCQNFL